MIDLGPIFKTLSPTSSGSQDRNTAGSDSGFTLNTPQVVADSGNLATDANMAKIGQSLISGDPAAFRSTGLQINFESLQQPGESGARLNLSQVRSNPEFAEIQEDVEDNGRVALDAMRAANQGSSSPVNPAQAAYFKQFAGRDGDASTLTAKEAGAGLLAGAAEADFRQGIFTDGDFSPGDLAHWSAGNERAGPTASRTYQQQAEFTYNTLFGK